MTAKWRAAGHNEKQIVELWNDYVPKHLLPRLYGFELLMAPYAIAHMKIGLKLAETGYRFQSDERARVYLTNSLEPAMPEVQQKQIAEISVALAHEAQAVNAIKRHQRFTVVVGNPPYSVSTQNRGAWVLSLIDRYKEGLNEKKHTLDDDYVKFVAFSQWCIEDNRVNPVRHTLGSPGLRETGHYPRPNRLAGPAGVSIGDNHNRLGRGPFLTRRRNHRGHICPAAAVQLDLLRPEYVLRARHGSVAGQYPQAARIRQGSQGVGDHAQAEKGDRHVLCEAPEGPFRQKVPVPFFRPVTRGIGLTCAGNSAPPDGCRRFGLR